MSNPKKQSVEIDPRGRLTLPKELREGVTSFAVERSEDGVIHLIPLKAIPYQEAVIAATLRESVEEYKAGKTKKFPKEWLDES